MTSRTILRAIKGGHTVAWGFFVVMIGATWVLAAQDRMLGATWTIAFVLVEVAILGLNHGRCPLGGIAERYIDDRSANYDIYLPAWLAGRTKPIFGSLFGGALLFTAIRWLTLPSRQGTRDERHRRSRAPRPSGHRHRSR